MTKGRLNIPERSFRRNCSEGKTPPSNDMPAHTETPGCLIHTFQFSTDWKMWDSVKFYHSETVYHCHCGKHTEWERWVDLSGCKHQFSSLISTSNEGSNIADPPLSSFSICVTVAQHCSSTHKTKKRQTIFLFPVWYYQPYKLMFYNSSENGPRNNCWVLTDANAYSKYCQEAPPRLCQHLSVNMLRSCLPALLWRAVKVRGLMLAPNCCHLTAHLVTATSWWLWMPASHPGHSSVLAVTWRKSQCNLASTTAKHDVYNLISQPASTLFCTVA